MKNNLQLKELLKNLDGKSYPAYKSIKSEYKFDNFNLIIDHVQGDPFASPSKIRININQSIAKFPENLFDSSIRNIALTDYIHRQIIDHLKQISQRRGSGKSGLIAIADIAQEVIQRSSVLLNKQELEVRLVVGLPANGRRILGFQAIELLCENIPEIVNKCLLYDVLNHQDVKYHVETVEDANYIRQELENQDLVAFVANDAILPRDSGISPLPLQGKEVIKFQSPPSLEVEFICPNRGKVRGMGIKKGITLIVGGGYHGKSTLLHAIELGIYNHIPDDGRELVITNSTGVKIRAEDGRSITGVDISPFINHLPQGKSTVNFHTPNASGSTSQSANIMEALEVGSKLLLIDEDTSATNFMIRDGRMQKLIAKEKEPITPLVDKIKALYEDYGVSTILVMGGSGDYFEVANTVIAMDSFQPLDVTDKAKQIALDFPQFREGGDSIKFGKITPRFINPESISAKRGKRDVKIQVRDLDTIQFGIENIDLASVSQLVENGQLRAIAFSILYTQKKYLGQKKSLSEAINLLMKDLETKGLDILTDFPQGDLTMFRHFELACAINRLRSLKTFKKLD
ncbi:ABC-ATPase domain-containing protein [Cyanobacterium aponinum AL20118]|uniref:ABC-ATPase domain-containing protein n=1 Tax=Cyanobacterium aponinum AL20115 TaxID=3090662 RepID=A0AAF0ZCD8_9CHRO|nr:ABC-ATPase domain-containing protein [Cyanobacterium aponinum]WPF89706.1 ABC-ATPase domain-containing protein [Cyanobacterium aponinum AL20115]WRL38014.1 ABC-ATPase domain-containing protein [Cyanobacterium aponinum UTEX 3221]